MPGGLGQQVRPRPGDDLEQVVTTFPGQEPAAARHLVDQVMDRGALGALRVDGQLQVGQRVEPVGITAVLADQDRRPNAPRSGGGPAEGGLAACSADLIGVEDLACRPGPADGGVPGQLQQIQCLGQRRDHPQLLVKIDESFHRQLYQQKPWIRSWVINARPCSPAIHSSAARASSQAPGCCSASFARAAAVQSRPRSTPCTGDAARATDTRWDQILQLYDQLLEYTPTPVIALNRAVALAVVHGPQAALDLVDRLDLDTYQPYHATRADLLRRLGRKPEAAAAYQAAIALSSNDTERAYLAGRLRMLS